VRYVELFAGAGGLSMGLEAAGMVPVAHAEIEPHARAVLRHHWPNTPLHGDVTQVDWTQYAGQVDLVAAGSPCQDLSVAGKRAGLAGARSGLFYELVRAWDEMGATYCLWENVDGARSSNGGKDFAAVLSAFVGAPVIVPRDGWASAGVVAGSSGVAAWRVLDLQHFGPPQRRRRLFVLAAREGGVDPAEVLALSEGVCGHPSPREHQRQGAARGAAGGAGGGGICTTGHITHALTHEGADASEDGTGRGTPIIAQAPIGAKPAVLAFDNRPAVTAAGTVSTLTTQGTGNPMSVLHQNVMDTLTGRPRRLTPKECERLMGWPDQHTAHGVKEDGTAYALSDAARYRLCGNGVGTPVAAWIADRLVTLEATV
jgi:DNA (cytosine-5)-methyltransferase 1